MSIKKWQLIPQLGQEAKRQETLTHLNYGAVMQNIFLFFGLLRANTQMGQ